MVTKKNKIFLVDDEIDVAFMLAKRLKWAGYDVFCHYQGEKAVALIRAARPDLVLLDIKLPDISGFEIYQTLHSDPVLAEIPVIFLSALHEEKKYCLESLKAKGFIQKPCDPVLLVETIEKVLAPAAAA